MEDAMEEASREGYWTRGKGRCLPEGEEWETAKSEEKREWMDGRKRRCLIPLSEWFWRREGKGGPLLVSRASLSIISAILRNSLFSLSVSLLSPTVMAASPLAKCQFGSPSLCPSDPSLPIQLLKKASGEISDVFNGGEEKRRKADLQKEREAHTKTARPATRHHNIPGKDRTQNRYILKGNSVMFVNWWNHKRNLRRGKSENTRCYRSKLLGGAQQTFSCHNHGQWAKYLHSVPVKRHW